ncbi:MAG: protein translocase subunit SecF [Burkholderiales bacterium]|jgi:preprotein translocase subunit SecF|nr:protein translocase subunit SecF [Betaproteobacteria bacterium]MCH1424765.1 protein translocase subunit SecF [Burkholderiales bacterium]MDA0359742.1 protein translocase subunit SecF [Pseudomonadota bacterium]MDA0861173.1 protein translocase subunit SecF [Pseudomonadota bacterium]MDA1030371.1 protein translocase subunit SecF [Pseudomonadota bacterium]
MEFFKIRKDIPFMRHALVFNVLSIIMFSLAAGALTFKGLNLGVEFTGGTVMEVGYSQSADLTKIRDSLESGGMSEAIVQSFGDSRTVLIRLPTKPEITGAKLSDQVFLLLKEDDSQLELRRVDYVGSQVGEELVEKGALALLVVSLGIVIYLAFRFEWKFGLAAILANLHDVVIILGFFALFQWEFSLPVLAAVLAILGYSVNESVVVFDRIRENFRRMRKAEVPEVINNAITRIMGRTIITHGSTQLMVLSILIFGGETLHYFALALTIGILFGIYSSIFVASPLILWLGISREDLIKPEVKKEEAVV